MSVAAVVSVSVSISLLLLVVVAAVVVIVVVVGGSDVTSSSVDGKFSTVSPLGLEAVPIVSLLSFNGDTLDKKFSQSAVFVSPSLH